MRTKEISTWYGRHSQLPTQYSWSPSFSTKRTLILLEWQGILPKYSTYSLPCSYGSMCLSSSQWEVDRSLGKGIPSWIKGQSFMRDTFHSSSCQKHIYGTPNHSETLRMKLHAWDGGAENWKELDFQTISLDTCINSIPLTSRLVIRGIVLA